MVLALYANDLTQVRCGTWIELTATSIQGYHFSHWSDNNTDSIRQVEVLGNATYIAFFAEDCVSSIPVTTRYNWILMIHRKAIKELGFDPTEKQVKWFRVVGEPDDLDDSSSWDDEYLTSGYSFTIDANLQGTGLYYAVMDVSTSNGIFCHDLVRSEIIQYCSVEEPKQEIKTIKFIKNDRLYIQTETGLYDSQGRQTQL